MDENFQAIPAHHGHFRIVGFAMVTLTDGRCRLTFFLERTIPDTIKRSNRVMPGIVLSRKCFKEKLKYIVARLSYKVNSYYKKF